jgi:hypothetical protein
MESRFELSTQNQVYSPIKPLAAEKNYNFAGLCNSTEAYTYKTCTAKTKGTEQALERQLRLVHAYSCSNLKLKIILLHVRFPRRRDIGALSHNSGIVQHCYVSLATKQ